MAEVLMPSLLKCGPVLDHQRPQSIKLVRPKAARPGQLDRIMPEFCRALFALNIHMRSFTAFQAVKEKPETSDTQNSGQQSARLAGSKPMSMKLAYHKNTSGQYSSRACCRRLDRPWL
jgi:hypothetical protein